MPQIFHRSFNTLAKVSIVGALVLVTVLGGALYIDDWSPYVTQERIARVQPVPFSHQHHVGDLGIDCRYCHTSVEESAFAGIPPTKTCMNCHSQIWTNAPMLEPVRSSYQSGESLQWTRVNQLPDFVYFNHSIHVTKGVGCNDCHGPVDQMPLMYQQASLQMEWCLNCHRAPEKVLRPREQVFNMRYQQPTASLPVQLDGTSYTDQDSLGAALAKKYQLRTEKDITSCSTCHR